MHLNREARTWSGEKGAENAVQSSLAMVYINIRRLTPEECYGYEANKLAWTGGAESGLWATRNYKMAIGIILFHVGSLLFLASYLCKDILWLRVLTVTSLFSLIAFYYLRDNPMWPAVVWGWLYIIVNLAQLWMLYLSRKPVRFSELEEEIYHLVFGSLPRRFFHSMFQLGSMEQVEKGTLLIKRNQNLDKLYLVIEGEAEVLLLNGDTRTISKGGFIGEQSFITGNTTSADVHIGTDNTVLLTWSQETLSAFLDKDPVLSNAFDLVITIDIIGKLQRMQVEA